MTETTTAYPLCWPTGRPRTPTGKRQYGRFGHRNERGYGTVNLSLSKAAHRVITEIERFTKYGPGLFNEINLAWKSAKQELSNGI